MEPECRTITSEMIPAVRAYLAEAMSSRYKLRQQEIAKRLGMTQVAVSKYINMKYSPAVAKAKAEVAKQIAHTHFVKEIMKSRNPDEVNRRIERFCEGVFTLNQ